MFFGTTNSLIISQTIRNDIFHNLIAEEIIIVYLDHIQIFTQMLKEYHRVDFRILEVLAKHKMSSILKNTNLTNDRLSTWAWLFLRIKLK